MWLNSINGELLSLPSVDCPGGVAVLQENVDRWLRPGSCRGEHCEPETYNVRCERRKMTKWKYI
jgi:hypothetical protein